MKPLKSIRQFRLISRRSELKPTIAVFVLVGLSTACGFALTSTKQSSSPQPTPIPGADDSDLAASPCAEALSQQVVCVDANNRALEIMRADHLEAITVIQDVRTGSLVAFAASQPSTLDVNTHVLPLSLVKVFLAAAWWDTDQPDASFDSTRGNANAENPAFRSRVSVHEMLVGGSDSAGRQMSVALRNAVGTRLVLETFERYGFALRTDSHPDNKFWSGLPSTWTAHLTPLPAYVELNDQTTETEWADTLSIGEMNMRVTALHVSRFMQAVGNQGVMLTPIAVEKPSDKKSSTPSPNNSNRIMKEVTAQRLQAAMRDTVKRGTAKSIATVLDSTNWQVGGKTGSGPTVVGPQSDGWFAGLIFDPKGNARFTVATFVRHGGPGGGNAAKISAELARFIINGRAAK